MDRLVRREERGELRPKNTGANLCCWFEDGDSRITAVRCTKICEVDVQVGTDMLGVERRDRKLAQIGSSLQKLSR